MDRLESPRGVRWMASQPYASLLVCATCIALQIAWLFVILALTVGSDRIDSDGMALNGLIFVWLLIPAGTLYGIYLARPSSGYDRPGGWLRGLGLLANLLYLVIGTFPWILFFAGVRV